MITFGKKKKSIKNLKKFRSAKFNYAKFVKKYYIEKGTAYISAKVNSIDDIVSKYSTKDYEWINPDFAHYIEECAYYIPIEELIFGILCLGMFAVLSRLSIITAAINEVMLLLLWFFLWEFADMAWLHGSELQAERLEAGQLSTAKITFLDNVNVINE